MNLTAQKDLSYVWHPFTQMGDWIKSEPIVICKGRGSILWDLQGREYLDANASIWTNLHGHGHPRLNRAIRAQLKRIAHSSALGLANEPASELAEQLVAIASPTGLKNPKLSKVFFSDDGSTAMEVALKMSYEFHRRRGVRKPSFLALEGSYHGDTIGAVSLGHIDLFHKAYGGLLFASRKVMSPYCYRCPFNRAAPQRADARTYRVCQWECVDQVENVFARAAKRDRPITTMVIEPLMQGAAGMIPQPGGWLAKADQIVRSYGAQWIADEVMTGFGRTGPLFACQKEKVLPDYLALAKGLTGGYLPMAATLTTSEVFAAFLGRYDEFKTFFHGHSYTGNQLGSAAASASISLLKEAKSNRDRLALAQGFETELRVLWDLPQVGDIRQEGLIAGVELVRDWTKRQPFALEERAGIRVCEAMSKRGVLTRPIGNVVVLMPPYSTTQKQLRRIIETLAVSIRETFSR